MSSVRWDTEVFIFQGDSRDDLIRFGKRVLRLLSSEARLEPKDLAFTLNCPLRRFASYRLAIVADSLKELEKKLSFALRHLSEPQCAKIKDRSGIFFFERPLSQEGTLAFLFPGEGSQYVNMLKDLCIHFTEARDYFDRVDRVFLNDKRDIVPSQVLFPPMSAQSVRDHQAEQKLFQMDMAATVLAADYSLFKLFDHLEIQASAMVGHSTGEFAALVASGGMQTEFDEEIISEVLALGGARGAVDKQIPAAKFVMVGGADSAIVSSVLAESQGEIHLSMDNCPHQVILCCPEAAVTRTMERLKHHGALCSVLPYGRPIHHTSLFESFRDEFSVFLQRRKIVSPHTALYSCATAKPYPEDPAEIRRLAAEQWISRVRFRETIEAMYEDGVRIFVEVGPRGNLTSFVNDILQGRRYIAVPADTPHRSSIFQLHYMVGLLASHGVHMRLDYLYERRAPKRVSLGAGSEQADKRIEGKSPVRAATVLPGFQLRKEVDRLCRLSATGAVASALDSTKTTQESNVHGQTSGQSQVMQEYLNTMEHFLDVQGEIVSAFGFKARPQASAEVEADYANASTFAWPAPVAKFPVSLGFQCCRVFKTGDGSRLPRMAQVILSLREQETWSRLEGPERRRREWLLGRLAAKNAVRLFAKKQYRIRVTTTDVEIATDRYGRPTVEGKIAEEIDGDISISISHSGGEAVALAGKCGDHGGVGIDIERVDQSCAGLETGILDAKEQALFSAIPASERDEWLLRLWCAKEAVAKAIGRGMAGGPLNLVVQELGPSTGTVAVVIAGQLARQLPICADKLLNAYTGREGILVFASALI